MGNIVFKLSESSFWKEKSWKVSVRKPMRSCMWGPLIDAFLFFFFCLMAPFSCFFPLSWFFPSFPPTTVFSLLIPYLTEATYNLGFPAKNYDTFTFPKESKQTTIRKSCFTVENRIPKSYWMSNLLWYYVLATHGHQHIGNVKPYF